jgi:hypothetical protein
VRVTTPVKEAIDMVRIEGQIDLQGTLMFDPIPEGTRMQWSWDIEPQGVLKVMTPLVALMGRRQEQGIWTGLKHLLEGQTGGGNAAREQGPR